MLKSPAKLTIQERHRLLPAIPQQAQRGPAKDGVGLGINGGLKARKVPLAVDEGVALVGECRAQGNGRDTQHKEKTMDFHGCEGG